MARNIVVLSDGTGQEGGKGENTNVYKLFNMIEDRTRNQIAFYDPGLGTRGAKLMGMASGFGVSKNIKDCYSFIFEHYEAGDRIYLLGFSRGAATVRSLSSFIHYFGVLPKSRPDLVDQAWSIYQISNDERRKKKAKQFIDRHHTMWARVNFLGCYDTVAALGVPFKKVSVILDQIPFFKHKFHNFTLSKSVENAYQALAIDDERKTFHPVLWNTKTADYQSIRQVWFCGAHTDVGGGYKEDGLSDIPLVWLTGKAVEHGLRIYPAHQVEISEDPGDTLHNPMDSFWTRLYRRKRREWPSGREDKPIIHQSVLERHRMLKERNGSSYNPWILDLDYEVEDWVQYEAQPW